MNHVLDNGYEAKDYVAPLVKRTSRLRKPEVCYWYPTSDSMFTQDKVFYGTQRLLIVEVAKTDRLMPLGALPPPSSTGSQKRPMAYTQLLVTDSMTMFTQNKVSYGTHRLLVVEVAKTNRLMP